MNIIKPIPALDTQPRAVSVSSNAPAPRISWQEEQQQFADAVFQASLEDGAARAFHETQARTTGAVVQDIKNILNGVPAAGSVTTIRQADGIVRRADVVPFRKSAPPPQRPRPPVQQPLRPAAELTPYGQFLRKMRLEDPVAFAKYLDRKMSERRDAAQAERIEKLIRR